MSWTGPPGLQMQTPRPGEGQRPAWLTGLPAALLDVAAPVAAPALGNRWLQLPPPEAKHFPWLPC